MRFFDGVAEEVDVLQKRLAGSAIVAVEELVDEGHFILIRIPLEVGDDPLARADEIAEPAACVALFEQTDGVVVREEADVGGETTVVRLREEVVGEVRYIVPDEEVGGDGAPIFNVLLEADVVRSSLQRLREIHFDAAKADDDVFGGLGDFGRLARILVGERLHEEVWILFRDVRRDGVDEAKQQAGRAAFLLFNRLAFGALAVAAPIVLRDGDHACGGILADFLQGDFDEFLAHLFVGEAELITAVHAFAVDFAVPFGMGVEIFFRREELIERMAPADDGAMVAVVGGNARKMAVAFDVRRETRLQSAFVERFAADDFRSVFMIFRIDDKRRLVRNRALFRRPPADADVVFQEGIDGVERTARHLAVEVDVVAVEDDGDFVRLRVGERRIFEHGGGRLHGTDDESRLAGGAGGFRNDGERVSRDVFQMAGELRGGRFHDGRGIVRRDDDVVAFALIGDLDGLRDGGAAQTEKTENPCDFHDFPFFLAQVRACASSYYLKSIPRRVNWADVFRKAAVIQKTIQFSA